MWVEETDEQGTPIFIAEGAGATKLSVKYVEKTARVKIINVYGKVTLRMLQDLPQLVSYIQNNMMKRVSLKTEDALFSGDGLNDNL
ncbi:phage major capsid protein, partial [Salmonella sp. s57029]|uniref:phage major capsid family protein n=1 Tax=Salmonella sp. s57029 TaxID=3159692 RepID=UPI003A84ACC8